MAQPRGKIDAACQNPKCRYYLNEKERILLRVAGIRARVISGITVIIAGPISWRARARHFIESDCQNVK